MRKEGIISHFGAATNAADRDQCPIENKKWVRWYLERIIALEEETGERGIDFLLNANSYTLLN
jgi:hypothetical protein